MGLSGLFGGTSWLVEQGVWMGAALALCLLATLWRVRQEPGDQARLWEGALWLLAGAALGATLGSGIQGYLGAPVPLPDLRALLDTWLRFVLLGPPSVQGAFLGALLALALICPWYPAWRAADLLAGGACLGGSVLWLGAARLGYAYGAPTLWAGALWLPDPQGLAMPRWPVQPVGAAALALVALLLLAGGPARRWPAGVSALVAIWAVSLLGFALGFFRADPTLYLGPFRADQLVALLWLLGAALLLPWRWRRGSSGA